MGDGIGLAQLAERNVKEVAYVAPRWSHTKHVDVVAMTCADIFASNKIA
jgi:hypothetical protein